MTFDMQKFREALLTRARGHALQEVNARARWSHTGFEKDHRTLVEAMTRVNELTKVVEMVDSMALVMNKPEIPASSEPVAPEEDVYFTMRWKALGSMTEEELYHHRTLVESHLTDVVNAQVEAYRRSITVWARGVADQVDPMFGTTDNGN